MKNYLIMLLLAVTISATAQDKKKAALHHITT